MECNHYVYEFLAHETLRQRRAVAARDGLLAAHRRELPAHEAREPDHAQAVGRLDALRILIVAVAAGCVWFRAWEPVQGVSVIGVLGLLVGGWPIVKEAMENGLARRMTMELSMAIAIAAAAAIAEFFTALVIALFVLVAEVLEGLTVARGRRAIRDLLDALPRVVSVRRAGEVRDVDVETLRAGDVVLVNPGGLIPVDGAVLNGHSFVDQARITGESMPIEKMTGDAVYAGSINASGVLEVRADRIGRDTSYGRIIEAVEHAESSRAPVQRLADRLAAYLVYVALGAAAVTFLVTGDVRSTIAVVIVAGACGIAAGTPLAILGGIGRAARLGTIVKGGVHLETLGRVDTVVLDKTGTLTYGRPEVQRVHSLDGVSADEVLDAAATAERRSEHPLGQAIVAHARARRRPSIEPEQFAYTPGRGIEAEIAGRTVLVGNRAWMSDRGVTPASNGGPAADGDVATRGATEVLVARNGRLLGAIAIADTARPEAQRAITTLRGMGIRTIVLTGDAAGVATPVARALGIQHVEAELLPAEKLQRIRDLVASGRTVAMVGDGINDAPALAAASVGVGMGSGTDVARESADAVLLGNDLERFVDTLAVARRARRIIWQNFAGTLAIDGLGIGLAAVGLLGPLAAAFVHVASELAFILNSARLLPAAPARSSRRTEGAPPGRDCRLGALSEPSRARAPVAVTAGPPCDGARRGPGY
jgi:Cd2+/Zn2+-exporting ATPase/Cu+-exporting ATPase